MVGLLALCLGVTLPATRRLTPRCGQTKIFLCVKKRNPGKGTVRMVTRRQRCKRTERRLVINSRGPRGFAGVVGPTGPRGPQGPPVRPAPAGSQGGATGPTGPKAQGIQGSRAPWATPAHGCAG